MMNIADALDLHAHARPDHPALVEGEAVLDHHGLADRVRRMAAYLRRLGARPHDVVGVCLTDRTEHVVALFALARAGLVILPMDARWSEPEKQRVVDHFHPTIVLQEPDAPPLDRVREVRCDDKWARAVAGMQPEEGERGGSEMPLVLSLSSGTTGRPKGPMVSHGQFFRRFMTHWINLGLGGRDCFVSATPLYFGGGRTFALSVLFSGGTVVLRPPPFAPGELIKTVTRKGATSLFLVPTQFRRLLELGDDELRPLRQLHLLFSSGAPLSRDERRSIRDRICPNFFEYYASTEGGGVSLLRPEDIDHHGESVGRPVFAVEVEAVDDADGRLRPGEIGQLRYRGPGVATGYYDDPEASREAFRGGWFYPGDLASLDELGFVTLKGRRKDMILRGGVNIYPPEIEATLTEHPAVAEAAVVGWPSRELGEEVAAFVRLVAPATSEDLLAFCRSRLARYKWPRKAFVVDELPRNSSGKVLKSELVRRLPTMKAEPKT